MAAVANGATVRPPLLTDDELPVYTVVAALYRETEVIENLVKAFDAFDYRTGDGSIVEFRSVVDAVNCAIEIQRAMVERNAGVAPDKRIEFRIGIHLGDVVEESDGDLMGDGVNIAARLEGVAKPGAICLSEQAHWQVKGRLDFAMTDLGATQLKNIAEQIRVYALDVGMPAVAKSAPTPVPEKSAPPRLSMVVLPFANIGGDPEQKHFVDGITESLTTDLSRLRGSFVIGRNTAFTCKATRLNRLMRLGRLARGSISWRPFERERMTLWSGVSRRGGFLSSDDGPAMAGVRKQRTFPTAWRMGQIDPDRRRWWREW